MFFYIVFITSVIILVAIIATAIWINLSSETAADVPATATIINIIETTSYAINDLGRHNIYIYTSI